MAACSNAPALPAVDPAPTGSGAVTSPPTGGAASDQPTGDAPAPAETNPNGGYWPASLAATANPRLGDVVADGEGFTLYRFDKDTADPSASNCAGECAVTWPPVLTRNKIVFSGIDRDKLGAVKREDGSLQVTLAGWPVYRFAKDAAPGEINGEAVGGTWFVIAPDGTKANGDAG